MSGMRRPLPAAAPSCFQGSCGLGAGHVSFTASPKQPTGMQVVEEIKMFPGRWEVE